jgi:mRNA interferase MazF
MAIRFPVGPGTILLCDYSVGFRPPEMVKLRPAVVMSPRLPRRDDLCTVVPLSLTPPAQEVPYQVKVVLNEGLPGWPGAERWAKADMLATVGFHRLDLFRTARDQYGQRKYLQPKLSPDQLKATRIGMLHALGLGALTAYL